MSIKTLSPEQARLRQQAGAILIDVREGDEYRREHIPGARHHALQALESLKLGPQDTVVFNCRTGHRTKVNSARLEAASPGQAYILEGGIDAWKNAGLPTTSNRSHPIEMMRQVQIAAGSLVLVGIGLGAFLNPAFYALAALVGAGLAFAGVTGTCGMARLLAFAPWNRNAAAG